MDNNFNNQNQNINQQNYNQSSYIQQPYNQQGYVQQSQQYVQQPMNAQPMQPYNQQGYVQQSQQYVQQPMNAQPMQPYNQQGFVQPQNIQPKTRRKNNDNGNKNKNSSTGWLVALCLAIIVIIAGLGIIGFIFLNGKKQIDKVKTETIKLTNVNYAITYGELFEKTIENSKWSYFKEDGENIVQINGTYKDNNRKSTSPIVIQFNIDDGIRLSCISLNKITYSLEESEMIIKNMYEEVYGTIDTSDTTEDTPSTDATTEYVKEEAQETKENLSTEETTELTTEEFDKTTEAGSLKKEKKEEFIFENSSTSYINKEDLKNFTSEQCRIARNEIYARHGRIFDDESLQEYFNSCSWYSGYISPNDFDESLINKYERANLDTIIEYEKEMGYR